MIRPDTLRCSLHAVFAAAMLGCGGVESDTSRAADSAAAAPAPAPPAPQATHGTQAEREEATPARPARPRERDASARRVMLGDLDLTGVGHDRGSPTAPVVMIDFSDYGCPYCAQFSLETYPVIEREYVATGKVFFKYVPFLVGSFPGSAEVTRAAECAGEQGRFWPMMEAVYRAQKDWRKRGDQLPLVMDLARATSLDGGRFSTCYEGRTTDARTRRATEVANDIGVRVTPSFVVNERPIEGALGIVEFRKVIEAALLVEKSRQ